MIRQATLLDGGFDGFAEPRFAGVVGNLFDQVSKQG